MASGKLCIIICYLITLRPTCNAKLIEKSGGIAVIYHEHLHVHSVQSEQFASFGSLFVIIDSKARNIQLIRIYRVPSHCISEAFSNDLTNLLESHNQIFSYSLFIGDFDIHIKDNENIFNIIFASPHK